MDSLNPAQSEAVRTLRGPLLVLAGAGTGKTRVVTFRVANLIRHGTPPDRILAVTFTNKASLEMQERIAHQLKLPKRVPRGKPAPPRPQIGTFHSHCVQILKRHAAVLEYPEKFSIYDRSDSESVARTVLREIRVHENVLAPNDFLAILSRWKNAGIRPEHADREAKDDLEHLAAAGYRRYQRSLKLQSAFDFDDLLLFTEQLLTDHASVRDAEAGRYDHILVDEYQDTNGLQYRIIRALAAQHRNLGVVGDDDQSIYGWRGAEVRHILNFRNDWPDAKVVRLEENYRSTDAILKMANRLIAFNKQRHDKVLRAARPNGPPPRVLQFPSEADEAKGIVEEIRDRLAKDRARTPGDFAILFRTNEQPRMFELELRRHQVPYTITGTQSFFDRKEVRDLLAYLRWIDQPDDELSLLRVINIPPRGIGAGSVDKLMKHAVDSSQSIGRILSDPGIVSQLPLPAQRGVASLVALQTEYSQRFARAATPAAAIDRNDASSEQVTAPKLSESADSPSEPESHELGDAMTDVLEQFIREIRYREEIQRLYSEDDEVAMRTQSIEGVINAMAQHEMANPNASLADFLNSVTLSGREFGNSSDKANATQAVALMTYHSAKGLEFPIVYMVGMEEGVLPHRRSITDDGVDEERRLCYVGVTRAQDELTLSLPMSRFKWGKARPTFPSRFLYELTGQADNPNRMKSIQAAAEEARKGVARR